MSEFHSLSWQDHLNTLICFLSYHRMSEESRVKDNTFNMKQLIETLTNIKWKLNHLEMYHAKTWGSLVTCQDWTKEVSMPRRDRPIQWGNYVNDEFLDFVDGFEDDDNPKR